jgi:PKD repeat protein
MEATNDPTSWAADPLPAGLTLDSVAGVISGTIAEPGVYSFQLTASNAGGVSAPMFVYLEVSPAVAATGGGPSRVPVIMISPSWLSDLSLIDLQFDLRLRGVQSTYAQAGGITLMQSDGCKLAVVLLTPAQVSDAVTLWLVAKTVEDSVPVIDLTVAGSAALTAESGGSYYLLQPNLNGDLITQAIDDMSAPTSGGPRVLVLTVQLAVQRGAQIARSQPFTINIIQRVAQAGAPNDIP